MAGWTSKAYLIEGRIETLKHQLVSNKADQISRGLAYKLFSALIHLTRNIKGWKRSSLTAKTSKLPHWSGFSPQRKMAPFSLVPSGLSLAHLSGFILNGTDAINSRNLVYVSHGWKSLIGCAARLGRSGDGVYGRESLFPDEGCETGKLILRLCFLKYRGNLGGASGTTVVPARGSSKEFPLTRLDSDGE